MGSDNRKLDPRHNLENYGSLWVEACTGRPRMFSGMLQLPSASLDTSRRFDKPDEARQAESRHAKQKADEGEAQPMSALAEPPVESKVELTPEWLECHPLLTRQQMAEYLGMSVSNLDVLSQQPGFPVLRKPHWVRFMWTDVVAFLSQSGKEQRPLVTKEDIKRKANKRTRK